MTDYNLREAFAAVIDGARVDLAAADADLTAFYELRMKGSTTSVEPDRAELLEDYDEAQLRAEVQREYYLTPTEMPRTIAKCIGRIADVRVGY